MAGITLTEAQTQLASWLAASTAVAGGQAYEIAGRSFTRVNAEHIDKMITFWDTKIKELSRRASGRSRARTVVAG